MTPDEVRDRELVRELVARYARALDTRDWEALTQCFTADAQAEFSGVRLEPGADAIVRHLRQLESVTASTHLTGNVLIDFDADGALVESQALVHLALDQGVRVRGVFYSDRLVRVDGGWRIQERRHRAGWSVDI